MVGKTQQLIENMQDVNNRQRLNNKTVVLYKMIVELCQIKKSIIIIII